MKKTKITSASEIKTSYLMWVGAEHYAAIKDYSDEAVSHGISKRMPTTEMALKLVEPGSVVFLAHDEGEYKECSACFGEIECGECRKFETEIGRLTTERADLEQAAEELAESGEDSKKATKLLAKVLRLGKDIAEAKALKAACEACDGKGSMKGGTGGHVVVKGEGEATAKWDYRRYNYWLHQPKVWSPEGKVASVSMCSTCGGTGRLPEGKVFGLFLPSDIEWIAPADADEKVKAEMAARGFKLVPERLVKDEPRRGCGKRKAGGVYVVTKPSAKAADKAEAVLSELMEKGVIKPEGAEVSGSFIRFLAPVPIEAKRFRGLKRWSLDPTAEREAEMILDAMAEA